MAFFLDDEPISRATGLIVAPFVQSKISDKGQITGLSLADANTLDTLLRTGAFPVPLKVVQQEDVDATLGDEAVVQSVQAGLIAILVVMAFMTLLPPAGRDRQPGADGLRLADAGGVRLPGDGDRGRDRGVRALGRHGG
jgi:hypothetical protein